MSSEERERNDALESLIAKYLEAEKSGQRLDRDGLIKEYPDLADSLRGFFANHDRMKVAANLDEPTLPPTEGASNPAEPSVGDQVRYFGDYELLEEIARGGMGVVFKARQVNLNRIVALKMILSGQFAGEEDVQRFYTEAEAAAQLDHPGIVPIFEIGEHQGQHYFSMGYIEGESLAQKVVDGPLPPREAAEMVEKICDAMAYAHERGVIHRDLKPANVLVDRNGQPKVTDFGLAKKTEADSNLTGTGQILGTPAYMPPEQASGRTDVGPLADVYSLGAILYCLLTGRPPFQAASPMDILLQVLDQEPVSLRALNRQVPQDLETICLKCLGKQPKSRYESAEDLCCELARFKNGEPIKARPVGRVDRTWRWCKRRPAVASLLLTVACLVVSAGAIAWRGSVNTARERARYLYIAHMQLADHAWREGDLGRLNQLLDLHNSDSGGPDLRGWEWYYFQSLSQNSLATLRAPIPENAPPKERAIREIPWEFSAVAFSPAGRKVAGGQADSYCSVTVWDWESGKVDASLSVPVRVAERRHHITELAWEPEGRFLAALNSDGDVRIWQTETWKVVAEMRAAVRLHASTARSLNWEEDNQRLSVDVGPQLAIWDANTSQVTMSENPKWNNESSPNGRWQTKVNWPAEDNRKLSVIDSITGKEVQTLQSGLPIKPTPMRLWSPDGQYLALGVLMGKGAQGSEVVEFWDVSNWNLARQVEHESKIIDACWSPDSTRLATTDNSNFINLWDPKTGQRRTLRGHEEPVNAICWDRDSNRIASAGCDGTVRVWSTTTHQEAMVLREPSDPWGVTAVAWSPDGESLALGLGVHQPTNAQPTITVWNLAKKQRTHQFYGHSFIADLAWSPDGKSIASAGQTRGGKTQRGHSIKLWSISDQSELGQMKVSRGARSLAWSPNSERLAYVELNQSVTELVVWEPATNTRTNINYVGAAELVWGSDGSRLDSVGWNPREEMEVVTSWDISSRREVPTPANWSNWLGPGPKRIAIPSTRNAAMIEIWDPDSRQVMLRLKNPDRVEDYAWSPDGWRLATASRDGTVRIWNAQTPDLNMRPIDQQ